VLGGWIGTFGHCETVQASVLPSRAHGTIPGLSPDQLANRNRFFTNSKHTRVAGGGHSSALPPKSQRVALIPLAKNTIDRVPGLGSFGRAAPIPIVKQSATTTSAPPPITTTTTTTSSSFSSQVQFVPANFMSQRRRDANPVFPSSNRQGKSLSTSSKKAKPAQAYVPPVYIPVRSPGRGLPGNNYGGAPVYV